ncbi:hypothetical protein HGRIS_013058 [Hohenbuehelia grisea]|uniref:Peptide N-acetyl-beta-D-glucosaminyl asparaginase amidase A N-terminal domain-containing protein n=1 Tax=Hohenbuehelia grisea TaxID=104357 RepID=A0ABR3IU79_9AGAR
MIWLTLVVATIASFFAQAAVLVNFQVAQPVPVPCDVKTCTVKVLQRDFAFSFGSAEVVQLTPPTDCEPAGSWSAVTLNFTVTSNGTQFDRLGIFTFQNVEIWRTSTPEPTRGDGIIWTYIKDVTQYTPLFSKPGTFILQLDNLIQPGLDGVYSTVLHATYYASTVKHSPAKQASSIIPLSTLSNVTGNDASVPPAFSISVTLPRNTVKVYAELYASGNGQEESWYFNVPNQFFGNIPPDITWSNGPFREVRLLIDGLVAGVAFPYATIFTGGFVPSAWRPISAYGALDLPTYFIDVTPFVPLLVDGKAHNFTIDVASAESNHTILQNWYVSGLLQVVTDSSPKPTRGRIVSYSAKPYADASVKGTTGAFGDVQFDVMASRRIHIESDVVSGSGKTTRVVWSQDLTFTNAQAYRENATMQTLRQTSTGIIKSLHNGVATVADEFSYPFDIDFNYLSPDLRHWNFSTDHAYNRVVNPNPFMISSTIRSHQIAAQSNTWSYNDDCIPLDDLYYNGCTPSVAAAILANTEFSLYRSSHQLSGTHGAIGSRFSPRASLLMDDIRRNMRALFLPAPVSLLWDSPTTMIFRALGLLIPALLLSVASQGAVLVDFQVAQPPPVPQDAKQCTVQVLKRDFAFSFGLSEIVQLTPPTDCGPPGSWAAVTLNFTVTSNGTQFDRLGIFTFQNVEIWRTSTPEPTRGDGIIWTYVKDVTRYTPLFAKPGTFILQLDNLIQTGLDGVYSTVLHATYYASSPAHPPAKQANSIIPLSTLANDTGNDASVPPGFSLNVTVPQNAVEVYAELYASGNGQEEFWYFNVPDQFLSDFPDGFALGKGPFREVRLLVDGQVAGVAFPYATIFTGGIVPTAWRPITSYGALDLPTYFLDLTPFVPILTDGKPHIITIDVASAEPDNHTILQNWFVSGLLQVVTDSSSKPTTGKITSYSADPFAVSTNNAVVGANGDVDITVTASRKIRIESQITSGSGKSTRVVFSQDLRYSNVQTYRDNFGIQNVFQTATGTVSSTHNGARAVVDIFQYPLGINITNITPDGRSFKSTFDHSYTRNLIPAPFILGSTIKEHQLAEGFFTIASTGNSGNGTSQNQLSYVDLAGNTYSRQVNAVLNNITLDRQSGSLAPHQTVHFPIIGPFKDATFGRARLPGGRTIGF